MDIFSRKIVGWSVHATESSTISSALITQTCLDKKIDQKQLVLHSDNGSSIIEYIEVFYNQKRLYSSLGYKSPAQFEMAA